MFVWLIACMIQAEERNIAVHKDKRVIAFPAKNLDYTKFHQ